MDKYTALKKYFGYTQFRSGQEKIIDGILCGKDVLAVMPTGAGKSLCFQIPALINEGTTIVISPLISLMSDQISALKENGIFAETINSAMNKAQSERVFKKAISGKCKLLYVSPERLNTPDFQLIIKSLKVPFVCVDEAHCVSHWGQDFRSSYLEIADFIASFQKRPVVAAFTATATGLVRDDICRLLSLREPEITVTGFDRKNLFFEVQRPADKFTALRKCLDAHSGKSSIVYCATRKTVDEVYSRLRSLGYSASRYHAGLTADERSNNRELFVKDKVSVMVATNAFGMGIDKSDVSLVVHYNMPSDIESYYQEAGRAGRDGSQADCVLFYSHEDIKIQEYFINNPIDNENITEKEAELFRKRRKNMLRCMEAYCTSGICLRNTILRYFGEHVSGDCGNCSVCSGMKQYTDITVDSQKALSACARAKGLCSKDELIAVLHGDSFARKDLKEIKTFGAMSDREPEFIEKVIDSLIEGGFMRLSINESKNTVCNTEKARKILFDGMRLQMEYYGEAHNSSEKPKVRQERPDPVLFSLLKELRKDIASRLSIPALAVFTDSVLREISAKKPMTIEEMKKISGMSDKKIEKYAPLFLKSLNAYMKK